jgi:parvulin-like peptidyl-prolyl isomerase
VGERAVTEGELLRTLLFFYRREYLDALNQAVNDVVVEEETRRLGVDVDPRDVSRRAEDEVSRLEGQVLVQFGGEVKLEEFVRDTFRQSLEEYRAHVLRVVRSRLLMGRLVRFEQMRQERFELRKIVVDDRARAETIVASLREGADFAILAEKESIAPSAKVGGRLPPVPRGALHPDLEAAVAALPDGGVSDPVELRDGPFVRYHVIKRLRRIPGIDARYADVRDEIEKGLEAEPLSDAELAYWNEAMTRRYGIRFAD